MSASTPAHRTAFSPKKYKAACDQCHNSKVKCPGGKTPCKRCADTCQPCHFSLAARIGKPPGSKNRKTLERLRRAAEGNADISGEGRSGDGSDSPTDSSMTNCHDGARGAENQYREGDEFQEAFVMPDMTNLPTLSPILDSFGFGEPWQSSPPSAPDFLNGDHGVNVNGGDSSVARSADLDISDILSLGNSDLQMPWADAPNDDWSVSIRSCFTLVIAEQRVSLRHQEPSSRLSQAQQIVVCSPL